MFKTATSLSSRDSDLWVECFGDEGVAQGFVERELLLYSLTIPLIICLPLKGKKNERRQQRNRIQRKEIKTRQGEERTQIRQSRRKDLSYRNIFCKLFQSSVSFR